ncbi:MAG: hypothetical protein JWP97_4123 [Labilithrix sp.]|nr:hypothetical protein [Labilithrix sp.]
MLVGAALVLATGRASAQASQPGTAPAAGVTVTQRDGAPLVEDRSAELPRFPSTVEELSAPRIPPPFVLPELSHPDAQLAITWMLGVGTPEDPSKPRSTLALGSASFEGSWIFPRRMYFGVTLPFASALAPDGTGSKTLLGNVELHARVIVPLPTWLAFGAFLGVVAPTSIYEPGSSAHAASLDAIALEPTELPHFTPQQVTLRPAVDLRVLRGPFVVQARQGLDIGIDFDGRSRTYGRFLGHVGVLIKHNFELSLEATQLYQFDERTPDDKRTAMTIGPGARILLHGVDLGLGAVTNLFAPLPSALDHFYALRISLIPHLD